MNESLDNWLDSLSITQNTPQEATPSESPLPSEEPQEDLEDLLRDYGFDTIQEAEVVEEPGEEMEYFEVNPQNRDLDAEENEAAVVSSHYDTETRQVHFHMPDGEVVDVPIDQVAVDTAGDNPDESAIAQDGTSPEDFILPPNSPTLLLDESTSRFSGAEWYEEIKKKNIIIAGCGGIGSNAAFQLARMVPSSLFLYDDDTVEVVNMAGQLFARSDVGKAKVNAITDMITRYTNMQNIFALRQKFESTTEAGNIMMCGFDNMTARRTFFNSWKNHVLSKPAEERRDCLYLDGRLSINVLQVFCIPGDDLYNLEKYEEEYLFSDEEAEHTVCSLKQTTYLACMIGSIMTNLFTNWAANLLDPILPYDLPFFTEYDAQNMIFKTVK